MYSEEEFQELLRQDRIEDLWYDEATHGSKATRVTKLYDRDRSRLDAAATRARVLQPNNGWLSLQQKGSLERGWTLNTVSSLECSDCLEYLGDWTYFFAAGHLRVGDRLLPPFCGDIYHWHSTRQGQWMISTTMLADNPEHCFLRAMANV